LRDAPTHRIDSGTRASRLFAANIGLAACGAVAIGISLRGAAAVKVTAPGRAGQFAIFGLRFSYPVVNLAAVVTLAFAVLGAVVVCLAARGVGRELVASRRFARIIRGRLVHGFDDVYVFDDERAQTFCAGLLRPRVYLSTGAARVLGADELRAVLAHERHHRDRHDPLRIALGRVLAQAMFFMPALARITGGYCATAELAADDAALRAVGGSTGALASAMLAFENTTHPLGAVGVAPERVDHLLGRHVPSPLPLSRLATALATAGLIAVIAWQAGGAAVVRATFSLPLLSAQPCVTVLALLPGVLGVVAARHLRRQAAA
jgi:Zn-dependent protease with chaperone function